MAVVVRDFIILLFYSIYFGLFYSILFYFILRKAIKHIWQLVRMILYRGGKKINLKETGEIILG